MRLTPETFWVIPQVSEERAFPESVAGMTSRFRGCDPSRGGRERKIKRREERASPRRAADEGVLSIREGEDPMINKSRRLPW